MTTPAPPAVPVYPAGYAPLDTDLDALIQVPLIFATQRIVLRVSQHVQQTFTAAGGYTIISFDTVDEDPYGGWDAGGNAWTAPFDGLYAVSVYCSVATQSSNFEVGSALTGIVNALTGSEAVTNGLILGGGIAYNTYEMTGGNDFIQGSAKADTSTPTDVSSRGRFPRMEILYIGRGT